MDEDGLVTSKLSLPVPLLLVLVLGAAEVRFIFGCFFFVGDVFSLATDRFFIICTISCLSKLNVGEWICIRNKNATDCIKLVARR